MVSLVEILNLKDRLVGLLYKCLETKSSDFSSGLTIKLATSDASSAQDLYFVFSVESRNEMLEICNRLSQMLASVKPVAAPNTVPTQRIPAQSYPADPPQSPADGIAQHRAQRNITLKPIGSNIDISTIPQSYLQRVASSVKTKTSRGCFPRGKIKNQIPGMTAQDHERVKIAVGFYMGSNPKPEIWEVAKKFKLKTLWLVNALLENGTELPSLYISKFPQLILSHDQYNLPTQPCYFSSLAADFQKQLTDSAAKWFETGNTESDKTIGDLMDRLSDEQRQDILNFYLKHRNVVAASWTTEQAMKKYGTETTSMNRCLALTLLKKSGKDIPPARKRPILEGKEEAILEHARSLRPEDLVFTDVARKFDISCPATLRKFLQKNGIQNISSKRRVKRPADQDLPGTQVKDPEKTKRVNAEKKYRYRPFDPKRPPMGRYKKLGDKKDLILLFARNQKPENLNLQQIVRMFDLKCQASMVSLFLKENGVQVLTTDQRRAKKLADRGLPYTPAMTPEERERDRQRKREYKKMREERRKADQVPDSVQKVETPPAESSTSSTQTPAAVKFNKKKAFRNAQLSASKSPPADRLQAPAEPPVAVQSVDPITNQATAQLNYAMLDPSQYHGMSTRQMTYTSQYPHYYY